MRPRVFLRGWHRWKREWCPGCFGRGFFTREFFFGEEEFECWNCDGTGRA